MNSTIQVEIFWKHNFNLHNELFEFDQFLRKLIVHDFNETSRTSSQQNTELWKLIQEIHYTRKNEEKKEDINPHISIKLQDGSDIRFFFIPRHQIVYSRKRGSSGNITYAEKLKYKKIYDSGKEVRIEDIFNKLIENIYVERIYLPDVNRAMGKKIKFKTKKQRTRKKPKQKKQRTRTKPKKQRSRAKPKK